jgi:hypothetical protein
MMPCIHCHNSSIPVLRRLAGGWSGCVRSGVHLSVDGLDDWREVLAVLEKWAGCKFDEWVGAGDDGAQLRMM